MERGQRSSQREVVAEAAPERRARIGAAPGAEAAPPTEEAAPARARTLERAGAWLADASLMAALGLPKEGGEAPSAEGTAAQAGKEANRGAAEGAGAAPASSEQQLDLSAPPELLAAQALELGMMGQPIALPHRERIERQLGRALPQVRCYTGEAALRACEAVGARAFVVADVMILAEAAPPYEVVLHEAVHLLQQAGTQVPRSRALPLGASGDTQEQQAHAVAEGEADAGAIDQTSPRLSGFFYLSGCTPSGGGSGTVATGPKGVSNADGQGWLLTRIAGGENSLPWYLKVNHTRRVSGRDEFEVLEGAYSGQTGSVTAKSASDSHLQAGMSYKGAAAVTLRKTARKLTYGSTEIEAFTHDANPLPSGSHEIQIPDAPHAGGASYGAFATTWFRLGTSGDRYLHPGRYSAGCATVKETSGWPALYQYLINSRQSASAVGTLQVLD